MSKVPEAADHTGPFSPKPQRACRRNALMSRSGLLVSRAETLSSPCLDSRRVMCCRAQLAILVLAWWRLVIFYQHCIALARFLHPQASAPSSFSAFTRSSTPKFPKPARARPPTACKRPRLLDAMMRAYGHANPASLSPMRYRPPPHPELPPSRPNPRRLLHLSRSLGNRRRPYPPSSPSHHPGPFVDQHAAARTVRALPCQISIPVPITTTHATVKTTRQGFIDDDQDDGILRPRPLPRVGDSSAHPFANFHPRRRRRRRSKPPQRRERFPNGVIGCFPPHRFNFFLAPGPKTVGSALFLMCAPCLPAGSAAVVDILLSSVVCGPVISPFPSRTSRQRR